MYYFVNKEKYCQICASPVWFYIFHFTCSCSLLQRNWKMLITKVIEIFQYFAINEKWCQLWISPKENVCFYFIPLFGFTLVIKLRNFGFRSYWNTELFLIKKDMASDLNMSQRIMSDIVLFPLFWFTLVIKLRNFNFGSHWNTLTFFYQINDV